MNMATIDIIMTLEKDIHAGFVDGFNRVYKYEENALKDEGREDFAKRMVYKYMVDIVNTDLRQQLQAISDKEYELKKMA